jgi:hypothetical protein
MAPRQWALSQTQVDDLLSEGSRYVPSAMGWCGKIEKALPIDARSLDARSGYRFFHPFYFTA